MTFVEAPEDIELMRDIPQTIARAADRECCDRRENAGPAAERTGSHGLRPRTIRKRCIARSDCGHAAGLDPPQKQWPDRRNKCSSRQLYRTPATCKETTFYDELENKYSGNS